MTQSDKHLAGVVELMQKHDNDFLGLTSLINDASIPTNANDMGEPLINNMLPDLYGAAMNENFDGMDIFFRDGTEIEVVRKNNQNNTKNCNYGGNLSKGRIW